MIVVLLLAIGVPLLGLVYLLVTSDPAHASLRRFVTHLAVTGAATWGFFLVLPDGGLLIAVTALVALFGCLTSLLHGRALLRTRR